MKYSIDAPHFNAVIACAAKTDFTLNLRSFCIDSDTNTIIATDGHIMAEAPITVEDSETPSDEEHGSGDYKFQGYLFSAPNRPLLKDAKTVIIDTVMERLEVYGNNYKGPHRVAIEKINDCFPNYRQVTARNLQPSPTSRIGLNPLLLAKPLQWAKVDNLECIIEFKGERSGMEVVYRGLPGVIVTLMPVRI